MIEVREGRRSPYRVRRLGGKLTASFSVRSAAEIQDALWARWGDRIPVLVDQTPKLGRALEARLLNGVAGPTYPLRFSRAYSRYILREPKTPFPLSRILEPLLGEYVVDFFSKWAEGKVILRGSSTQPKARKTIEIVQDGLHRIVFETRWERDERGWRVRDEHGFFVDLGWGDGAAAWIPLREFDIEHVLALAEKVEKEKVGKEIWRKVRSFLKQLIDYAQLKNDFPRGRANPVTLVAAPPQTGVRLVRKPYTPDIVEEIRADFLVLEALVRDAVRRTRRKKGRNAGWRPRTTSSGIRRDLCRPCRGFGVRRVPAGRDPRSIWTSLRAR